MKKSIIILLTLVTISLGIYYIQPHEYSINGVEDGKVYAKNIDIEIESGIIPPNIKLNGKTIEGHDLTISENGEYQLNVTSRFLWMERNETITFQRDDLPPPQPVLQGVVEDVYFQSAKFEVKREPGVTYEARIEEDPYVFGESYTKEGVHTLHVTAHKENGLTSKRQFYFEIDNRTYTQDEVDTFLDFYFSENNVIVKYKTETDVIVHGNPSQKDLSHLKSITEKLSERLPIQLNFHEKVISTANSRIDVHFLPTYKFKELDIDFDDLESNYIGVAFTENVFSSGINNSYVLIGTNRPQEERMLTITHEMLHAVGLHSHFEHDRSSVLYPDSSTTAKTWSEKDLIVLEILYHPDIEMFMERAQVSNTLKKRIKN